MFVHIGDKDARRKFVDTLLEFDKIVLISDKNKEEAKEEIINSRYPISINFDTLEVDYIKNTTCAAAACMNKSNFTTPEEALKMLKIITH